jgi:membrane protein required for beta-lactamase induction
VATAADGVRRSSAPNKGSSSRSILCWSIMVTLAGVCASLCGAREAVMTIWLLSMGSAGMNVLLLTNLSSQRDAPPHRDSLAHAPRLDPAEETDDGPRQVPDFAEQARLHSCGHSAGFSPASL